MKILLLGAGGFIGQNLKPVLEEKHELDFRPLGKDYEIVIHLASKSNIRQGGFEAELENLRSLNNTLQNHCNSKVIYLSTTQVLHGPESIYAWGKLAAESLLDCRDTPNLVFRCANPYGPHQRVNTNQGLIMKLLWDHYHGHTTEIWSDNVRDYFYISDLCRLIENAVTSDMTGTFSVGSGHAYSPVYIIDMINRTLGVKLKAVEKLKQIQDIRSNLANINRTKWRFSWEPEVPLSEGIQKTWRWLNETLQESSRDHSKP